MIGAARYRVSRGACCVVGVGARVGAGGEEVAALIDEALTVALGDEVGTDAGSAAGFGLGACCGSGLGAGSAFDAEARAGFGQVAALVSVAHKIREPALRAVAAARDWPLLGFPAATLAVEPVPSGGSAQVRAAVGTPSVAEAAALHAARLLGGGPARLILPKRSAATVTVAIAGWRISAG